MALSIAIVSLVVSLASVAWSIYQGRRSLAAVAREEGRREEELGLLRRQIAEAAEARKAEGGAILTAYSRGENLRENSYWQTFHVRNVGRAGAREVVVWIAQRTPGIAP